MPLASTRVIHPHWSAHHRRTAESAMTATVRLVRIDDDPDNDADAWSPTRIRESGDPAHDAASTDSTVVYEGPASVIAQTSQSATANIADQEVTVRTFAVSLPLSAPRPRAGDGGDQVLILASPGDPGLVGRSMRIIDVALSSESFARDVIALMDLSANNPPPADAAAPAATMVIDGTPWSA